MVMASPHNNSRMPLSEAARLIAMLLDIKAFQDEVMSSYKIFNEPDGFRILMKFVLSGSEYFFKVGTYNRKWRSFDVVVVHH